MKPLSLAGPFFAFLPKDGICNLPHARGAFLIVDFQLQSAATRAAIAKAHQCVAVEERKLTARRHF
jgi:hypothetical protein